MTAAPGMARLVGEGWALGVFQQDGGLVLGIPVESGHRSFGFEFAISARDLAVLESDPYRRKALDFILHETLQPRLTRGDHAGLAPECSRSSRPCCTARKRSWNRRSTPRPIPPISATGCARRGFQHRMISTRMACKPDFVQGVAPSG